MIIINKSIRVIDYVNESVYVRDIPDEFNEYINELVRHINSNGNVREYKSRSIYTEVISSVLQILQNKEDDELVTSIVNVIAKRLLDKEIDAQKLVGRLDTSIQKGSLIQALLFDETNESYTYLLAKVEHSDFVDDADFTFKTGFSKDKKTIWKSCLLDLTNPDAEVVNGKIYSNTVAKYWWDGFLELDEMISDEYNTMNAFKSIDETLKRNIRSDSMQDYTIIRNAIILYFKSNTHIDYNNMLEDIIGQYHSSDLSQDKLNSLKEKLSQLPEKKHFDHQFNSVPSIINAKIKKTYKVNDGIELKLTDAIDNLNETITAHQEPDGTRFLRIITNDDDTYNSFRIHD